MSDDYTSTPITEQIEDIKKIKEDLINSILLKTIESNKKSNKGDASTPLIDIIGVSTNFISASAPAGETFACYETLSAILKYMTTRYYNSVNNITDQKEIVVHLDKLLSACSRLHAEFSANELDVRQRRVEEPPVNLRTVRSQI